MTLEPGSTMNGGPIGTVLGTGSTSLRLTNREREIADRIGFGWSSKKIGRDLKITAGSVDTYVSLMASRIPGDGAARLKVAAWIWEYGESR